MARDGEPEAEAAEAMIVVAAGLFERAKDAVRSVGRKAEAGVDH